MKSVSQKQFKAAVKRVLNGGTSKLITTREEKPFTWSRSKGHFNLKGNVPVNSKFLRNDGVRGGKEHDLYLVCYLAPGYSIEPTKAELRKEESLKKALKKEASDKRKAKAAQLAKQAKASGFKSVAAMKRTQSEIDAYNQARFERAKTNQIAQFEAETGKKFEEHSIQDRVRLSRIGLIFDCERRENVM